MSNLKVFDALGHESYIVHILNIFSCGLTNIKKWSAFLYQDSVYLFSIYTNSPLWILIGEGLF